MRLGFLFILVGALLGPKAASAQTDSRRAAVAVFGVKPNSKAGRALRGRIRAAVGQQPNVLLIDEPQERLLFAGRPPPSDASAKKKASTAMRRAQKALAAFDFAGAKKNFDRATRALRNFAGRRSLRDLDRQRLQLGVTIAHAQRNEKTLAKLLSEYVVRFGKEAPPGEVWPPDVLQQLETTATGPKTKLEIAAQPQDSVFIDGERRGVGPMVIDTLPAGVHRIEIERPDHFPFETIASTSVLNPTKVEVTPSPKVSVALASVKPVTGVSAELRKQLVAVGRAAGIDQLFLVTADGTQLEIQKLVVETEEQKRAVSDDTPEGVQVALAQLVDRPKTGGGSAGWWPVAVGAAGVAAIGVGTGLRFAAVSSQGEYFERQGALTQAEAFAIDDRVGTQGTSGALLLGTGGALVVGAAAWMVVDWLSN